MNIVTRTKYRHFRFTTVGKLKLEVTRHLGVDVYKINIMYEVLLIVFFISLEN